MKNISKPIIVIGSGRSGTTIISEILFRHEDLAWPSNYQEKFPSVPTVNFIRSVFENKLWSLQGQKPQLNKVSKINKILFKPAEAYNFWEYLTGPKIDFSRGFLIEERPTENDIKRIRKAFRKLVNYQSKSRLAFKITGPSRIGYLKAVFPDAIFINVVREPLATINSWLNVEFWQEKGKHQLWWTGAYTQQEEEWATKNADKPELLAAMQYRKLMEITEKEIADCKAHCLTIKYEDFVENASAVINSILHFAELDSSKSVEEYLSGIKIFNQNKNEANDKSASHESEILRILKGSYAF